MLLGKYCLISPLQCRDTGLKTKSPVESSARSISSRAEPQLTQFAKAGWDLVPGISRGILKTSMNFLHLLSLPLLPSGGGATGTLITYERMSILLSYPFPACPLLLLNSSARERITVISRTYQVPITEETYLLIK